LDRDGQATLQPGMPPESPGGAVAWGTYTEAIDRTGWSVLDLHTSEHFGGDEQSYAAGFLEGVLTSERMAQHQGNMWGVDFHQDPVGRMPHAAANFTDSNLRWMRGQVQQLAARDEYWRMVGYLLEQVRGVSDGYNAARKSQRQREVSFVEVLMQSVVDTDMDDLLTAVVEHGQFVNSHYRSHGRHHRRNHGHCSALVQVAPGNSDLWVGHVTWDEYRGMLRIVKYLDMPLPGAAVRRMSFTSTPGALSSGDDWYVTDQDLTVLETTISNYNRTLWQRVQPDTLLTWVRAMVANRLATTGKQWTELQLRHQSGTCNNQWMVVDYKLFVPGHPVVDNTLWVCEAMPGLSHAEDMTRVLREQGSWPSYNIPYFEDIWEAGGYRAMQEQLPKLADAYSFDRDVRARMFARARAHREVTDFGSFMRLLRYNDHRDPLAGGNVCNGISARCDLNPTSAPDYDCFGGIDAKVRGASGTSADLSFYAVSSPTYDQEVAFSWHRQDSSVDGCKDSQHIGHPDTWNFSWYRMPSAVGLWRVGGDSGQRLVQAPSSGPGTTLVISLAVGALLVAAGVTWSWRIRQRALRATSDAYVRVDA